VPRYNGTTEQLVILNSRIPNGDGVITEADKVIVGHPNPDFTYGMTNTLRFKDFELSFLIQGIRRFNIFRIRQGYFATWSGRSDNHPATFVHRWRSPADQGDGRFGKAYSTYNAPITSATDMLYSSDYIRVRNITVGYNLKNLIKTKAVSSARIYLTLENWFGHDKYYNGLNPEAATQR